MLSVVRVACGTAIVLCFAVTSSHAGSLPLPAPYRAITSARHPPVHARLRAVRVAGSNTPATVSQAPGCSSNGSLSFVGEPGAPNFKNYAGGGSGSSGYAGAVAGESTLACDTASGVLAGVSIYVGGDGASSYSGDVAGYANSIDSSASFLGAGYGNSLGSAAPYTQGDESAIASGANNTVGSPLSFIGAGTQNTITANSAETNGQSAFIGAGYNNAVAGNFAAISSGQNNSASGDNAAIVAGQNNTVSGRWGIIAAGQVNTLSGQSAGILGGAYNTASGYYAFIGDGYHNYAGGQYAAIAGGNYNTANGSDAAVSGGSGNTASGTDAAVAGGYGNTAAGTNSYAAGTSSHANNSGAFVWSDDASGAKTLTSTVSNQFLARAAGGFYLYSAANLSTGVRLSPGSGSWSSLSDRAAKTAIEQVDDAGILAKVAALPVSEWSYTAQGSAIRHLGPMAQDFRAAFGLGEDDKHITAIDEEGVALAAIKALSRELADKDRRLALLARTTAVREAEDLTRMSTLEKRVAALSAKITATTASNAP